MLVVPKASQDRMLESIVNKVGPEDLRLHLYQNDVTPSPKDSEKQYVEADFIGYSSVLLYGIDWEVKTGTPSISSYPKQTFASSVPQPTQKVYGYYVANSRGLMWAERFAEPYPVANQGDEVSVSLNFTLVNDG